MNTELKLTYRARSVRKGMVGQSLKYILPCCVSQQQQRHQHLYSFCQGADVEDRVLNTSKEKSEKRIQTTQFPHAANTFLKWVL